MFRNHDYGGGRNINDKVFKNLLCDDILLYILHEEVGYIKNIKDLNFNVVLEEKKIFIVVL